MRVLLVLLALFAIACSGSNPSSPTPPPPVIPKAVITVHVTTTGSGEPLSGLQADLGGQIATTNGDGGVQYQIAPGGPARLALTGAGIIPRSVMVATGTSREAFVDAISTSRIDPTFYRGIVRNAFEGGNEPLRRWTRNPSVYLQTFDSAGNHIDAVTLNTVEVNIRSTVPVWTNGQFVVETVERGTASREGSPGWLTVKWSTTVPGCGQAQVGLEGGTIEFQSQTRTCWFGGSAVAPTVIRHELGHAMGFWHTDGPSDLMKGGNWTNGDLQPSARERAAAAIAYSRPVGNTDPDVDPASVVTLAPMTVR